MDRDKILFQSLLSYSVMTTKQIGKILFPGVSLTTVLRRLGKLENAGYIERIEGLSTYEKVWIVTQKGALIVSTKPILSRKSRFQLEHDVKLTAVRLKLEVHEVSKFWIPEHEIRSKVVRSSGVVNLKHKTIPDGIMSVEHGEYKESVAVEVELHLKNARRYERTFWDYKSKPDLLAVWYLVPTKQLGKILEKHWQRIIYGNGRPIFIWSLVDEVIHLGCEANLYSQKENIKIHDYWTSKIGNLPADSAADGVSKENEENKPKENELSAEIESKTFAPTG